MEAFHSRCKAENRLLFLDALTFADLERLVDQRITYSNGRRRHSSLGTPAPLTFLASFSSQRDDHNKQWSTLSKKWGALPQSRGQCD
jgi:hypothetical protein